MFSPFGNTTLQGIQNEIETLTEISESDGHANIITIWDSGRLPRSNYYYIDMELCDLDLNDYIQNGAPNESRLP